MRIGTYKPRQTGRAKILILIAIITLGACSPKKILKATLRTGGKLAYATVKKSGEIAFATAGYVATKGIYYASDPQRIAQDIDDMQTKVLNFLDKVQSIWGGENIQRSSPTRMVKYIDNFNSRALIDFDAGIVRIETLGAENFEQRLQNALVTTLLSADDPRALDLFSDQPVEISNQPYLLGQVVDQQGEPIDEIAKAEQFAHHLLRTAMAGDQIKSGSTYKTRHYIEIPMVADHLALRKRKYQPLVLKHAQTYGVSRNLIFAIIHTESDFNRFAISHIPAFGLMQIVPKSAGRDAFRYIHKKDGIPSRDYLFDPSNNIEMGSAYLNILDSKYLKGIKNPLSREYCVIAAYNGGAGRVLRSFSKNRKSAFNKINSRSPAEVYKVLTTKMPTESRRYLKKVLAHKKEYVRT